ncbi:MAG: outer membrane lipoprotein-sorting protein [Bryobacteraceae bacterium]
MTHSFTIRQLALAAALAGSMCAPVCAQTMSSEQIFAELIARNQIRADGLLGYTADRVYRVSDPGGKIHAQIEGRMEFEAPESKTFVTRSEAGSAIVRHLALKPLIASEINAAGGKDRHDSAITPANYTLELIGEDEVRTHPCYVLRASPKRADKYLFEGKVWIDKQDFAVARIEGHPAANLSFWIKRADFVRDYEKVAGFWLPLKDETAVQVRMYGKKILTIDHAGYAIQAGPLEAESGR